MATPPSPFRCMSRRAGPRRARGGGGGGGEPGLLRFLREAAERLRPLGDADIKSFEAFRQVLARIERVTYADMDREMGVFGDPDYCVERVRALKRDYGMDEFICYFNQGGIMDHTMVRQSMTRFAREVMP